MSTVTSTNHYVRLCMEFPPKRIKNDRECSRVEAVIHHLLDKPRRSLAEDQYLDTLSTLVEVYEDEHHPIDTNKIAPHEVLRFLMGLHGLCQADLAGVMGGKTAVSLAVNGKRELSKRQIQALARKFRISPAVFFEPSDSRVPLKSVRKHAASS
jgi:HTH-type transcriptional regulator / antitoxin HigA